MIQTKRTLCRGATIQTKPTLCSNARHNSWQTSSPSHCQCQSRAPTNSKYFWQMDFCSYFSLCLWHVLSLLFIWGYVFFAYFHSHTQKLSKLWFMRLIRVGSLQVRLHIRLIYYINPYWFVYMGESHIGLFKMLRAIEPGVTINKYYFTLEI